MSTNGSRQSPHLQAALYYASRGWHVFPTHTAVDGRCSCGSVECGSPGKHPRTRAGLQDATTDREQIVQWWTRWPGANVAIRTGVVSGLLVLDLDAKHGDPDAMIAAVEVLAGADCPQTTVSLTGGGGRHLLFALDPDGGTAANSSGRLGAGIDVRGENGYIVAPPSLHKSGQTYAWAEYEDHEWEPAIQPASARWLKDAIGVAMRAFAKPDDAARGPSGPRQYLDEVPDWVGSALQAVSPDCSYQDWITVGMALEQLPGGFELFDAWSRRASARYPGDDAMKRQWRGIQGRVAKVQIGTLWEMAKRAGWVPPKREVVPLPDDRHAPGSRPAPRPTLRVVGAVDVGPEPTRISRDLPPAEPPPGFDDVPPPDDEFMAGPDWEPAPTPEDDAGRAGRVSTSEMVRRLEEWSSTLQGLGEEAIADEVTTGWAPRALASLQVTDSAAYHRLSLKVQTRLTGAQRKALMASIKAAAPAPAVAAKPSVRRLDTAGLLLGSYRIQPGENGRPASIVRVKVQDEGEKVFHVCAPPVYVSGVTSDVDTGEHFTSLTWTSGGREYALDLPQDQTHTSRLITGAAKHGLPVSSSTAGEFVDYLVEAEIEHVARHGATLTTRRTGWHGSAFLRGPHVHAPDSSDLTSTPSLRMHEREQKTLLDALTEAGTLAGWVEGVAPALERCEPLRLYMAASMVPPLLGVLGTLVEPFVVDMVSTTSQGKTTALRVVASAWGVPHGLQREWNATWVALDRMAGMCNGLPLFLNESQLGPRQNPQLYAQMVYGLTSRVGKARGSIGGLARQERYESVTLSNGENSLAEMTGDGGLKARCLTYWGSPWGGTTDEHRTLALRTRELCDDNHGHAARAVCDYLVTMSDERRANLREVWRSVCKSFTDRARHWYPDHAVAPRLATYAAACEVAGWVLSTSTGVMPETTQWVTDEVWRRCLERSASADRASAALEELLAWIGSNPEDWARNPVKGEPIPMKGWAGQLMRDTDGGFVRLHVLPNRLSDYLTPRGFNVNSMLSTWHERGWIVSEAGKSGQRFTVKRLVAGEKTRCVSFTDEGLSKLNGLLGGMSSPSLMASGGELF